MIPRKELQRRCEEECCCVMLQTNLPEIMVCNHTLVAGSCETLVPRLPTPTSPPLPLSCTPSSGAINLYILSAVATAHDCLPHAGLQPIVKPRQLTTSGHTTAAPMQPHVACHRCEQDRGPVGVPKWCFPAWFAWPQWNHRTRKVSVVPSCKIVFFLAMVLTNLYLLHAEWCQHVTRSHF